MIQLTKPVPWITLLVLLGCPPGPVPPVPDASDASSPPRALDDGVLAIGDSSPTNGSGCGIACSVLADLGCAEGKQNDCQVTLQHAQDDRLIRSESGAPLSCTCVGAAKDKTAARACGVRCP